jgi:iron complex outermembrane receptor protein
MKAKSVFLISSIAIAGVWIPTATLAQGELEEITVTAMRREESLQDVPISVTALSAQALTDAGISEAMDLAIQTPGLTLQQNAGGLVTFIRGVGSLDASAGQEASVVMYEDGIYKAAPYGNTIAFNNVERVEVLKGPQGTLFGRNATGGLVQIITRDPSQEAALEGSLSYGDYDTLEGKVYGTTGLGDQLAVDLAVYYHDQGEGYGTNVDTGREVVKTEETLVRSKLLYTPGDNTRITLGFSNVDSEHSTGAGKQFLPGVTGLDGVTTYTGDFYDLTGLIDPFVEVDGRTWSLHLEHDFGGFTFKSITADQRFHVDQFFDNDQTLVPIVDVEIREQSYDTFTQEFQLLSNSDSGIRWIVGAFYLNDEAGFAGPPGLGLFGLAFGGGGVGIQNQIETESIAGFGEVTFPIAQATDLTIGARYTEDKRKLKGKTDVLDGIDTQNVLVSLPFDPVEETFSEPTYRAVLSHRFSEAVMAYGSYSRGYKAGNFNTVDPSNAPFEPEIVDAFEIGFKSDLFERRFRLNGAVFFYEYDDIQLTVFEGPTTRIVNAASAETTGAELEAAAVLTDYFDLNVGLSWLDTEITDFPNATYFIPAPVGGTQVDNQDASGNELPRAPEFTVSLTPTLSIPMGNGTLRASATYYYSDGFFWDHQNFRAEDSYDLLNASIGWSQDDRGFGVRLFGNNLLDTEYSVFTVAQGVGDSFAAAPPRTFGVEVNFSF